MYCLMGYLAIGRKTAFFLTIPLTNRNTIMKNQKLGTTIGYVKVDSF